jgi:hypothetical protein
MKATSAILVGCVLATACLPTAFAKDVKLNTESQQSRKWTVYEVVHGKAVPGPAKFINPNNGGFGNLPGYITIPFLRCNGYWRASRHFHIPVGATNLVLHITALGVDDRAVIELNGAKITAVGTLANGEGDMQLRDPGQNEPYYFPFLSGPVSFDDTTHLKPGRNEITVIVNNTGDGINGTIEPIYRDRPSYFGIVAKVSYTP